jgi:hypothetical protein
MADEITTDPITGEVQIPESWRMLPGTNQGYAATPEGEIVRLPRTVQLARQGKNVLRKYPAKVLTQSCIRGGYKAVGLTLDGHAAVQRVHRLVCTAFHGPPPSLDKGWVLHRDGDPSNNRPENLRWGSAQENSDDLGRHIGEGIRHKAQGRARCVGEYCIRGHLIESAGHLDEDGVCRRCKATFAA